MLEQSEIPKLGSYHPDLPPCSWPPCQWILLVMENSSFGMHIQKGAEELEVGDAAIGTDTKEFCEEQSKG